LGAGNVVVPSSFGLRESGPEKPQQERDPGQQLPKSLTEQRPAEREALVMFRNDPQPAGELPECLTSVSRQPDKIGDRHQQETEFTGDVCIQAPSHNDK